MDVKGVIRKYGFTMDKVAHELGITRVTLSQNLSRNPTVNTLQKIADVVGCRVGDFFYDERENKPNMLLCPKCGAKLNIKIES